MSDNPYQSPELRPVAASAENPFGPPSGTGFRSVAPRRPGVLVALCILALLLGTLAVISAVFKAGSAMLMPWLQQISVMAPPPGSGPQQEMQRITSEMNKRQFQIAAKYSAANLITAVVQLLEGALLIVGAALTLQGRPSGRSLFLSACVVAILYEIFSSGVMFVIQMEQRAIIENFQEQFAESLVDQMPNDPNAQRLVNVIVRTQSVIAIAGIIWLGIWTLLKITYFVWAMVYLRRQRPEKVFAAQAVAGPAGA